MYMYLNALLIVFFVVVIVILNKKCVSKKKRSSGRMKRKINLFYESSIFVSFFN